MRDLPQLAERQAQRMRTDAPLRHLTRNFPKQSDLLVAGGSIYWVLSGLICVRQRILDIRKETDEEGLACAALVLDPELVSVAPRPQKPFQGWRYLRADAAPPDLPAASPVAEDVEALPSTLRAELAALGLL